MRDKVNRIVTKNSKFKFFSFFKKIYTYGVDENEASWLYIIIPDANLGE